MATIKKILVFILAFSIINQSIDFDYATFGFGSNQKTSDYDDIDSLLELLVEKIAGDADFTDESNDDSGMAQHTGLEKHSTPSQYFEQVKKVDTEPQLKFFYAWHPGIDQTNKICKGFTKIIAPPPKSLHQA